MNIKIRNSFLHGNLRGKITNPLVFNPNDLQLEKQTIKIGSPNSLNCYVEIDHQLSLLSQRLFTSIDNLKQKNRFQSSKFDGKVIESLKQLIDVVKKMEFYRIENYLDEVFYDENGLFNLYQYGSLKSICMLSDISKYRTKNDNQDQINWKKFNKDELEIIFKDICLKISKDILKEFKSQMYYPSVEMITKILQSFGLQYDFSKSFEENFNSSLKSKEIKKESKESLVVLFTLKIMTSLNSVENMCYYLNYAKNTLLDRNSGILTAQYESWVQLYETSLRLYSRYAEIRQKQWLQIDQILSNNFNDEQFQNFLKQNMHLENVKLSSINFYIKNCSKQWRQELKQKILSKIDGLMTQSFWKYVEDILEYLENELDSGQRQEINQKIVKQIKSLADKQVEEEDVYEIQYGITFLFENFFKYFEEVEDIIEIAFLQKIYHNLSKNSSPSKTTILFRLFNQIFQNLYLECKHEQLQDISSQQQNILLSILEQFFLRNYVCSKSVFKLFYQMIEKNNYGAELMERLISILAEAYLIGSYQENSDLEFIHSEEQNKIVLINKILSYFQVLSKNEAIERKQLIKCLQSTKDQKLKQSYLAIRAFKNSILFQGIQNICIIFNPQLSFQTLQFGLLYCTPLTKLDTFIFNQQNLTILSVICEEMPIETLKFVYRKINQEQHTNYKVLGQLSQNLWQSYETDDRRKFFKSIVEEKITIQGYDQLKNLRKTEFVLNMMNCVFDKLNEHSQKNIKQIKSIYEKGSLKVVDLLSNLTSKLFKSLIKNFILQTKKFTAEQLSSIDLIDEQEDGLSLIQTNYISKISILKIIKQFNLIGKIISSTSVTKVEKQLLPCFISVGYEGQDKYCTLLGKMLEYVQMCQVVLGDDVMLKKNQVDGWYEVQRNGKWAKNVIILINSIISLQKQLPQFRQNEKILLEKLIFHQKTITSKLLLPSLFKTLLFTSNPKPIESLIKILLEYLNKLDHQYQQQFIYIVQEIDQIVKSKLQNESSIQHRSSIIMNIIEAFFELIMSGIRIRSYHIYRLIKCYLKLSGEDLKGFNTVLASNIKYFFEQFVTNYKVLPELVANCKNKKDPLGNKYQKLMKNQHNLNFVECACTLSMFINLYCRLNHSSLSLGIQKLFKQSSSKHIYLDYLIELTRKLTKQQFNPTEKQALTLKIDVFGNVSILINNSIDEKLLNKVILLGKCLLRLKQVGGINRMVVQMLEQKIQQEQLEVNLEEFQDQHRAISLGAMSVSKKLNGLVHSNLDLCNLIFITGQNLEKYIQLNKAIFQTSVKNEAITLKKLGIPSFLTLTIKQKSFRIVQNLLSKVQKYYELAKKDKEYIDKLYSVFKILCISCLNQPEIIPLIMEQKICTDRVKLFSDFLLQTLKIGMPLFCEFYTSLIKTNSGFIKVQNKIIPLNYQYQQTIKQKLLNILKEEITTNKNTHPYLFQAIMFIINYSNKYRFRKYKFVKICEESFEKMVEEDATKYLRDIVGSVAVIVGKQNQNRETGQVFQMLELCLHKLNHPNIYEAGKVKLEETFKNSIINKENNKQNISTIKISKKVNKMPQFVSVDSYQSFMKNSSLLPGKKPAQENKFLFNNNMYFQESVLSYSDTCYLTKQWEKLIKTSQKFDFNSLLSERMKNFNQQVENKDYMKDMLVFDMKTDFKLKKKCQKQQIIQNEIQNFDAIIEQNNSDEIDEMEEINEIDDDEDQWQNDIPRINIIGTNYADKCLMDQFIEQKCLDNGFIIESSDVIDENSQIEIDLGTQQNISEKIIEQNLKVYNLKNTKQNLKPTLSNITSLMELEKSHDGSIKIMTQSEFSNQSLKGQLPIQQEVSKDNILHLIEDLALNPEAIKEIFCKIKFVKNEQLIKILSYCSGEVQFLIENQLKARGICHSKDKGLNNDRQEFFIDQSRIYQKIAKEKNNDENYIPELSFSMTKLLISDLLENAQPYHQNLLPKIMLVYPNLQQIMTLSLQILTLPLTQFQAKYNIKTSLTEQLYRHNLIDLVFACMLQNRIALNFIFSGLWNFQNKQIVLFNSQKQDENTKVIELILQEIIKNSENKWAFLKVMKQYTVSLQKVDNYSYPYYPIQDKISISDKMPALVSQFLQKKSTSFSNNPKMESVFIILMFLDHTILQKFLSGELKKIKQTVHKTYLRQKMVLNSFKMNYADYDNVSIERKAEIYWQMRKIRKGDENLDELERGRKIMTEISQTIIQKFKDFCFSQFYKKDEIKMKGELTKLKRKVNQAKNFSDKRKKQKQYEEHKKLFGYWKNNLINSIVNEEIRPVFQELSKQYNDVLYETEDLFVELYSLFGQIIPKTPILYRICSEFYKIMLCSQLITKQQESIFRSMSNIKTVPSLESMKETITGRRRSHSKKKLSLSISQGHQLRYLPNLIKKVGNMFNYDSICMEVKDPLFKLFAKYTNHESKLKYLQQQNTLGERTIQVNRENVWIDTISQIDDDFINQDIKIKIKGQIGLDYGGVTRQWLGLIVKELMDPRLGLFQWNINKLAVQPSKNSSLISNHLEHFQKFGILVGKALKQNWLLEVNFTKSFLKHLLGFTLYIEDLEDIDPDTCKGLLWILNNQIDEDLGLSFIYEEQFLHKKQIVELIVGGNEISVNESNKKEYIKKMSYVKMTENIRQQSKSFMNGIEKVVPYGILKLFNYKEIGKYLSGTSIVKVQQMKLYAKYENYQATDENIQWFWQAMQQKNQQQLSQFLFFLTGSYKVPYNGFKQNPITINKMPASKDYLPVAHTCFSIIDLPEFSSKQKLKIQFEKAVVEGKGFSVS